MDIQSLKNSGYKKLAVLNQTYGIFQGSLNHIENAKLAILRKALIKRAKDATDTHVKKLKERKPQCGAKLIAASFEDCKKISAFMDDARKLLNKLANGEPIDLNDEDFKQLKEDYKNLPLKDDSKTRIAEFFKNLSENGGKANQEAIEAVAEAIIENIFYVSSDGNSKQSKITTSTAQKS